VAKFFFGAAAAGHLRLRDIPDGSEWDPKRIVYWDEIYIDGVSRLAQAGQKVRSAAELDDLLAASRQLPATRWLWIHEGLLDEAKRRWRASHAAAKSHWGVGPAMIGAAFAVALAAGLIAFAGVPQSGGPLPALRGGTVHVLTAPLPAMQRRGARSAPPRAVRPSAPSSRARYARGRPAVSGRPAYAVSVGRFASAAQAERMKHLVGGKGYIVMVVPRGATSEVATRPYRTREQAVRVARGLAAAGVPAHLLAWHFAARGDRFATY
jgi:hypothetical protein